MNQWRIGDVKITRVTESEAAWETAWLIPNATRENVIKEADWLFPLFSTEDGKTNMSIQAFVIESQGKRIVVDTCIGNEKARANPVWNDLHLPFLQDLERAGFTPDSIDQVICTHLHVDHVGWNTTRRGGGWVATFPSARYLFERTEWDYWSRSGNRDLQDPVEDSVRPIVEAGLADLIDPDRRITSEVWLESTPGHTPGHMSVRISSRGQEAVITGDLIHHPIQCAYPEWNSNFDYDATAAYKTRRDFLARHADRDILVFGTHFASPACGRIVSHGSSFRFVAAP
jgi:glyoxylase-like metal-dependent hydrolase (beta-lactamase superfamily II)